MKKTLAKIAFLSAICLLALAGIAVSVWLSAAHKTYAGGKPAGMVNGEPFFREDLAVYAADLRAAVAADYGRRFNLSGMGAEFWDTRYGGSTPRAELTRLALNRLVRDMVLLQEARRRGIDAPSSYHDIETERAAWNTPDGSTLSYGPNRLGPAEFSSYRISGISDELKTALLRTELSPTEAQLRAAYDSLPAELKYAPHYAWGIRFKWSSAGPSRDNEIRAGLERALRQGLAPEAASRSLSGSVPDISHEEFELHSEYISKEDAVQQELAQSLENAAQGSCIPGPQGQPELYYITGKEGGGILAFEDAPGLGQSKWLNDQFKLFLDKKAKAAKVKIYK